MDPLTAAGILSLVSVLLVDYTAIVAAGAVVGLAAVLLRSLIKSAR